ncbi:MAG: DUF2304 domain-containing protein [Candidatus Anammoximicrobium sp.]|nr:DUF2304 domain-containing protein [Candidatus Anammoximicrobium sp.]
MTAERLMLIGGVSAFLLTVYWVRSRRLRERYAIGWLTLATALLLCGVFPNAIMRVAEAAHLSYASAVLFAALTAIYCFAFLVTVSLTRQYRQSTRLLQELALLKHRLSELENPQAADVHEDPKTTERA